MNKEEYLKARKDIDECFCERRKKLDKEYALSNNPVKIGDIITDHYKTIRVEKFVFRYDYHTQFPFLSYRGIRLNKKGEPAKRGIDDNSVLQHLITKINGKPYKYELK